MVEKLAHELVSILMDKKLTLSLAESCTGGMASQYITGVDGCSQAFLGGVVSYSNAMKNEILGVSNADLEKFGAVSKQVAVAMAEGMRKTAKTSVAGSVTGIAGPQGGTPDKPIGTVHIAVATEMGTVHKLLCLIGNREEIRLQTVEQLFGFIKETIDKLYLSNV